MSFVVKNASGYRCSWAYCTSIWSNNYDEVRISFFKFPKDHQRCASWVEKCEAKYLPTTDFNILHKTYKLCSLHFEDEMFQNTLKKRLKKTAIPTLFTKKLAKSQESSLVCSKNIEISNPSSEIKLMINEIFSIDDLPLYSTPSLDLSTSQTVSVPTSTNISEATQNPRYLSLRTPRKITLQKKLAVAHTTIKELKNEVNRLTACLKQTDTAENVLQLLEKYISPSLFTVVKNNILNKDKSPRNDKKRKEIFKLN